MRMRQRPGVSLLVAVTGWALAAAPLVAEEPIDFNRDIRPILSNKCFICHGPDEAELQAGLRLDHAEGALGEADSGAIAIVPGKPDESELLRRVMSDDDGERMPPAESSPPLDAREVELLTRWIRQGAHYAQHWSYELPTRPELPEVQQKDWPRNAIDHFILARLEREGLKPSPEADRYALARRLSLDLTGLPPTLEEAEAFAQDQDPQAYERLVDRLLAKPAYGEHWALLWLDLARYADSSGYADDPPREIWAYRDWVIRALNANQPFDEFTIDQIAGDLLPNADSDALIATAFHRNTLTNNEGGTNDEEFRNVAVVDRVNTTMAVWMGTTMACAQCHTHKYDPITHEEYYQFFAIFNSSEDADRRDESPLLQVFSPEQQRLQAELPLQIAALEKQLTSPTPELVAAQQAWEAQLAGELTWHALRPETMQSREQAPLVAQDDGSILAREARKQDVYTLALPIAAEQGPVTALRLETLPDASLPGGGAGHGGGNFVITGVTASLAPQTKQAPQARFVRVELPGSQKMVSLAEVQVFQGAENVALQGEARQSTTDFNGPANLAIDGRTEGQYAAGSVTHTAVSDNPWWEVDLKTTRPIERVVLWNRTDNGVQGRLSNFRLILLDERREPLWEQTIASAPNPSAEYPVSDARPIAFQTAFADFAQPGFDASHVLDPADPAGWAVGGQPGQPHALVLIPRTGVSVESEARLTISIAQLSPHENHTLGRFRVSVSTDPRAAALAQVPAEKLALLRLAPEQRSEAQRAELTKYYLSEVAPQLADARTQLAQLKKQLAELKPTTTVPIMRELPAEKHRETRLQHRGNFLDLGQVVTPGVPAAFHPLPAEVPVDRLALARWLVDEQNPLTARVIANRYWETIFGRGLVETSEEFGSQGDPPSHPELLDWLATELVRLDWDIKALLKTLVMSNTYRQSSRVDEALLQRDPDNVLLARGPRFRLSAETIRDQMLAVSGLLSSKMYGPPVKPPQPQTGLNAAFGGGIDWQTSTGEDRYRRGIYTSWRRSNPYPSMTTFDAPNREVCTVRRIRTNTPLQALATLNDPVAIEAAQALARRMLNGGDSVAARLRHGFQVCLTRSPSDEELAPLAALYEQALARFTASPDLAKQMATEPLGPAPEGANVAELAAWTVVGNVLLNLDEFLMNR